MVSVCETKTGVVSGDGFKHLEGRLLAHGGSRVVMQSEMPSDLAKLLEEGRLFDGTGSRLIRGAQSRCHTNSAIRYLQFCHGQTGYSTCEIVSGYGLSRDGLWRQHTWLWADERLVETTVRRILYYGAVLSPVESVRFALGEVIKPLPAFKEALSH